MRAQWPSENGRPDRPDPGRVYVYCPNADSHRRPDVAVESHSVESIMARGYGMTVEPGGRV